MRDASGKFLPGNDGAFKPGNPYAFKSGNPYAFKSGDGRGQKAREAQRSKAPLIQTSTPAIASDAKTKRLEGEVARLSKVLGLVESYHASASEPPPWSTAPEVAAPGAATACLHFSDLHLDETINPGEVGGLNAYSREIAEQRMTRWANKACDLGERFKHQWEGALILWGGDMVSGAIHEELRETNDDVLPGTMVHWAPRIAAALRRVADYYGKVHIASVVGNHGRLTMKMQAKRRGRNSWDWLLIQMVKAHLSTDVRFSWDIAQGSYLFVPLYGDHIYLTHGDEVHGGGGWAGVWSPLGTIHRRGIELAAAHGKRISYATVGHWHQLTLAHTRGLVCNGSMKGWDEFAASLRLRPEPAMQGFWAHTPTRGVTIAAPIFCEDRKAEGW